MEHQNIEANISGKQQAVSGKLQGVNIKIYLDGRIF